MSETPRCSSCGGPMPKGVPGDICTACLLAVGKGSSQAKRADGAEARTLERNPSPEEGKEDGGWIGPYKLLEKIGEGGCGVVYVAEQEKPVRRRVALKVIKLGMDTRQVVARFEAERQALALMDHPNIAKVLDAGASEAGRPYFVMELVKGVRITDYCDRNNLSTQDRLRLFIQVCQAVQHAHQKGIIHRDIKPSNILVTLHDGVPVPKVIDFGIAKATSDQRLTDKTLYTALEQFIGTPAYMSPEQAELSGLDIDTRSDIYSLGVLLYELLTGKTPFDAKRFVIAGLDEVRRIIREEDPPRPSTRISTLDAAEQSTIARRRHSDLPKLVGMIRGDLDWVVMKTLEKDRTRRYETANGLAMDLQRHLNNEPVAARPPSNVYRFQKLVGRHKVTFAGAAALLASLTVAVCALTYLFVQERHSRQQEERLRQEAEAAKGQEARQRQQAEAAEQTAKAEASMLGEALTHIGDVQATERVFRDVIATQRRVLGQEDLDVLVHLAFILQRERKLDEAEDQFRSAIDRLRAAAGSGRTGEVSQMGLVLHHLADVRREKKDLAEARSLAEQALTLYRQHPDWPARERQHAFGVLGSVLEDAGDTIALKALYADSLALVLKVHPEDAEALNRGMLRLANLLRNEGRQAEAQEVEARLRAAYAAAANEMAAGQPPPRLVGWWKCEGNALDSAGTNHGQLLGSVTTAPGAVNQGLRFNGLEGGVEITNAPSPQRLTVMAWVQFDRLDSKASTGGYQLLVFRKNSHTSSFEGFCVQKWRDEGGAERLALVLTSQDFNNTPVISTSQVMPGVFYHVAATFDGAWACLYVNGVLETLASHPFPIDYGDRPMFFGTSGEKWDGPLAGVLDEVRMYDRALSPAQISELFEAEKAYR